MKNNMKRLKGKFSAVGQGDDNDGESWRNNPFLAALENPDILSEDSRLFPERDFDAEQERAEHLKKFKAALRSLTPKQRTLIAALARHKDQIKVGEVLGLDQSTISRNLLVIQKKLNQAIHKSSNGQ